MTKNALIKKNAHLFWYFDKSKLQEMSDDVLVEFILNYGTWEAFCDLLKTFGLRKVSKIFKSQRAKKRSNLLPEIANYFHLFFKSHVPEYTQR